MYNSLIWSLVAQECANNVTDDDLAVGRVYPTLERIHEVSHKIAVQVATYAFDHDLALAVCCICFSLISRLKLYWLVC